MQFVLPLILAACLGQSSGVAKLQEFVDALNSKSQANVETFVRTRFSPTGIGGRAIPDLAARFLELAKVGTPLTVGKVLKDESTVVIVEIKNPKGDDWEMKMTFEPDEPHGVTTIYMGGPGSQSNPPKHYTEWKSLSDLIEQIKTDTKVPAIGAAFFKGDPGKIEVGQFAVTGEREINKSGKAAIGDKWLIGSITKSMTATMIARLVDQGLMRWDMTIAEALPKTPMRSEYRAVTLLQLLHHRAGIQQDRFVTSDFLDQAAGESHNLVEVREHYTRFTLARDPIAKPDERMEYSNAGYSIAAHMAETVAKKPYESLMRDLVFKPLGMETVTMGVPGSKGNPGSEGQLMGHVIGEQGLEPHVIDEPKLNYIQEPAGAGVSMCLADLLKFAQYHLAGLRGHVTLMNPKNFDVLHRPAETGPGVYQYACGWVINDIIAKETIHGHSGSDGTFYAEIAIWPNQNFAAVGIINCNTKQNPSPPLQAIRALYERYAK